MKNITKIFKFIKPYKKWAILAPILIMIEATVDLLLPTVMINIVNVGIANSDFKYIVIRLLFMLFLTILGAIGAIGCTYFASKASQNTGADIRSKLYKKVINMSFHNLDKFSTGTLITRLTNDVTIVSNTIMMILRIVIRAPFILIGSIILAIIVSPNLSLIFIGVIPIMVLILIIIVKKAFPLFTKVQEKIDDVNRIVQENLTGIRIVKAFAREDYEIEKFKTSNKNLMNTTIKSNRLVNLIMPTMILAINVIIVLALWIGGNLYIDGGIELGNILAFIEYAMMSLFSLLMLAMIFGMTTRAEASAKRILDVLEEKNEIRSGKKKTKIKGEIEFKNVSFEYAKGQGKEALYNINFKANPGEVIALIGATGSGKSTLVNLIPRFYDVNSGEILIDGINIKEMDKEHLRKNIGIALQKTFLFSGTIKENIAYSNSKLSDKRIKEASSVAEASNFIEKLDNKYKEKIEQRGTNLSGGQKQRIAIARAIANNPKILILDDTTSAVDVKTEGKIRSSLKKVMKNRTTFIVAARITSAMTADKIIVLDDGEISDIGTHDYLIKNNKIYKDIYNSQLGGEK